MTSRLDIHASKVSPPPSETETRALSKARRHQMRRTSGRLLKDERVAKCGRKAIGQAVTLHKADTGHHFGSVETCGSVWTCPVCAAKITEQRREEIDNALKSHHAGGGVSYMMTLTLPHVRLDSCKKLLDTVRDTWRGIKTGNGWYAARDKGGYIGDVRALEVTHGKNGWHPHLHILVFLEFGTTEAAAEELGFFFFERWSRGVEKRGHAPCSPDAFTFRKVDETEGAAAYLGKWGAAMELTKAHTKRSKNGGRTPWQILEDCQRGSKRDVALFCQYARAFKGARQLTWAGDIRHRYCEDETLTDHEAAEPKTLPETQNATFHKPLWDEIDRRHLQAPVLTAADEGGQNAVIELLRSHDVQVIIHDGQSLDPRRSVPWLCLDVPANDPRNIKHWLGYIRKIEFPGNPEEGVGPRRENAKKQSLLLAPFRQASSNARQNPVGVVSTKSQLHENGEIEHVY